MASPTGQEDHISWCQNVLLRAGCAVRIQDLLAAVLAVATVMVAEV